MNLTARLATFLAAASTLTANATTLYVSPAGGHVPPFTNWVKAATNIQDAVDAAFPGDEILSANDPRAKAPAWARVEKGKGQPLEL